jgi:hypothetical protein
VKGVVVHHFAGETKREPKIKWVKITFDCAIDQIET